MAAKPKRSTAGSASFERQERGKYRKGGYYKLTDGTEFVGLKRRPDGRFYAAAQPTKAFGKDPAQALFRFKQWQAEQKPKKIKILDWSGHDPDPPGRKGPEDVKLEGEWQRTPYKREDGIIVVPVPNRLNIDEGLFWERVRCELLNDQRRFAQKVGVPEIAYLHDLAPPSPSVPLKSLLDVYLEKGKPSHEGWTRKVKLIWWEFCEAMGGDHKTVRDLTSDDVMKYRDGVMSLFEAGKVSRTYVSHRFGQVKMIFNFSLKRGIDQQQIKRVLIICAVLAPPSKRDAKQIAKAAGKKIKAPEPIAPKQFTKLLGVCDAQWKATFLLSLNCLLYPAEVAAVRKTEIDLNNKTFISDRGKTGISRVAVLWDRTVPPSVCFEHLRDGGYTAAIESGAHETKAKLIAGHIVGGMSDAFIRRNPKMVEDCCRAIDDRYSRVLAAIVPATAHIDPNYAISHPNPPDRTAEVIKSTSQLLTVRTPGWRGR